MEIVLATRNRDKVKEMKVLLQDLPVEIYTLSDFPNFPPVEEDGKTLEENALKKARLAAQFTGKLALADDSGLEVEALNGAPGVYSSRFAGEEATYLQNNLKLLKLLKGVPAPRRGARFRCVVALAKPSGEAKTVEGIVEGRIATELRGGTGFGYDPLFILPAYEKTFAELGLRVKNRISHRARALLLAKEIIRKMLREEGKG